MRYLFLHPVFPGQFHRVMESLAAIPGNEVIHLSRQSAIQGIPGVKKIHYKIEAEPAPQTHPFARKFEESIHHAQAVAKVALNLKKQGFVPDLIYGFAGWGPTLFMKDIFPDALLVGYFEWFLNAFGAEYNFDPLNPLAWENQLYSRVFNANMLMDLHGCDFGVTPTHWQQKQFPAEYQSKLHVLHDGVDTDYYQPKPGAGLQLPGIKLDSNIKIVTYATRGMEPFRGFPQFMRALALLQQIQPDCHAVIVGNEEVYYSKHLPDGKSYKELLLEELTGQLDLKRVHFTGWLEKEQYRKVLQASSAHVYLTHPYVLSWSLMEAMATGCLIVGSKTAPVEEVITDGENGLLVDFFDHQALADRLAEALSPSLRLSTLRSNARQSVMDKYDVKKVVPQHLALLQQFANSHSHNRNAPLT